MNERIGISSRASWTTNGQDKERKTKYKVLFWNGSLEKLMWPLLAEGAQTAFLGGNKPTAF
jgi:hypothetical protein